MLANLLVVGMGRCWPHVWRQLLGAGYDSASLGHRNQSCPFPRNSHSQTFPKVSGGGVYLQPVEQRQAAWEFGVWRFFFLSQRFHLGSSPSGIIPLCLPSFLPMGSSGRHLSARFPLKYSSTGKGGWQCPNPHPELLVSYWFVFYFVRSGTITP